MNRETAILNLSELIDLYKAHYINWERLNRGSPDYDPTYAPEFPDIVKAAEEGLKELKRQTECK